MKKWVIFFSVLLLLTGSLEAKRLSLHFKSRAEAWQHSKIILILESTHHEFASLKPGEERRYEESEAFTVDLLDPVWWEYKVVAVLQKDRNISCQVQRGDTLRFPRPFFCVISTFRVKRVGDKLFFTSDQAIEKKKILSLQDLKKKKVRLALFLESDKNLKVTKVHSPSGIKEVYMPVFCRNQQTKKWLRWQSFPYDASLYRFLFQHFRNRCPSYQPCPHCHSIQSVIAVSQVPSNSSENPPPELPRLRREKGDPHTVKGDKSSSPSIQWWCKRCQKKFLR